MIASLLPRSIFTCFAIALLSTTANATLVPILDGQAVYDTDLNITWLADANLPSSNGFGVYYNAPANGGTNLFQATDWINAMNDASYLGFSNWRLPVSNHSCWGSNCTSGELGQLFYNELGGVAGSSITTTHNTNYDLFTNIQSDWYWTGTVYDELAEQSVAFGFHNGSKYALEWLSEYHIWAVHSGNLAELSSVPVPAAIWLFGSGLTVLFSFARHSHNN